MAQNPGKIPNMAQNPGNLLCVRKHPHIVRICLIQKVCAVPYRDRAKSPIWIPYPRKRLIFSRFRHKHNHTHTPSNRHEQRPATDSHAARRARSRPDRHLVARARHAAQPRPARHRDHGLPTAKRLLGAGPRSGAGCGGGPRGGGAAPQPGRLYGNHGLSTPVGRLGAGTAQPLAKLAKRHRHHRRHDPYPDLLVMAIKTLINPIFVRPLNMNLSKSRRENGAAL